MGAASSMPNFSRTSVRSRSEVAGVDAVNHAVGESDVRLDPAGKVRCHEAGEAEHCLPGHVTVFGKVVAGKDGEGGKALVLAQAEGGNQDAEDRLRIARVCRVMDDFRMGRVKAAGLGVDVVAAFGDGQRDDPDVRPDEDCDQAGRVGFREIDHGAGNAGIQPARVQFDNGCQPVLRCQPLAHGRIIGLDAGADQTPVVVEPLVEQPVQINRLMGPVKVPPHRCARCPAKDLRGHKPACRRFHRSPAGWTETSSLPRSPLMSWSMPRQRFAAGTWTGSAGPEGGPGTRGQLIQLPPSTL